MKDIRKRLIGVMMIIALLLEVLVVPSQDAQAADINKKAGKAFAKALEQKKISYNGCYCVCDIDSDGVKELIVEGKGIDQVFWKYKKGKISKLGEFGGADGRLTYDKKKKTFWCCGDGDGAWMQSYKLKNGHFKATGIGYYITSDGKRAEKHTKKSTKKISVKEYTKIKKHPVKNNAIKMKKMLKWELIAKLQGTPKFSNLPTEKGKYYGAVFTEEKDKWGSGAISKISFKGNKMIIKGSLREATSKKKLLSEKGRYLGTATRTFTLDKNFTFYGSGGDMGTIRYTLKEGKELCKYAGGQGLEFKVKNKKLVSLTFCS